MDESLPSVSFIIPTFNSGRVLDLCLESIKSQDYPAEKVEIIIVDAGSSDETLAIAKKHKVEKILNNPLKTGEAGKAVGIKESSNEIIALLDSDNLLDGNDWLRKMVEPFKNNQIISSEVLYWTYRREDSLIDRYCALTGVNDPICLFLGNYGRYSYLTGKWTEFPLEAEIEGKDYVEAFINKDFVPTMGANGYLVRKKVLQNADWKNYYFDIDIVYQLVQKGFNRVARPKIGIVHLYCNNIKTFGKKQARRINDYFYFKKQGMRNYKYNIRSFGYFKYLLYTLLVFPLFFQSLKGYSKKPDPAWFFHPLACWITLWIYGLATLKSIFKTGLYNRNGWKNG